jgi:hypothetical protein
MAPAVALRPRSSSADWRNKRTLEQRPRTGQTKRTGRAAEAPAASAAEAAPPASAAEAAPPARAAAAAPPQAGRSLYLCLLLLNQPQTQQERLGDGVVRRLKAAAY